jgi:hypothetical protein
MQSILVLVLHKHQLTLLATIEAQTKLVRSLKHVLEHALHAHYCDNLRGATLKINKSSPF